MWNDDAMLLVTEGDLFKMFFSLLLLFDSPLEVCLIYVIAYIYMMISFIWFFSFCSRDQEMLWFADSILLILFASSFDIKLELSCHSAYWIF